MPPLLDFNRPLEHLCRTPCHVDAIIVAPFNQQIPSFKVNRDFPSALACQDPGHRGRAGARTTGPCLPSTTLPNSHSDCIGLKHFDEFRVDALGKKWMVLEARADALQIQAVQIIQIKHAVRIPHRDASDLIRSSIHFQWMVENFAVGIHGNFSPLQNRLSHVNLNLIPDETWSNDSRESLHGQLSFGRQAVIPDIPGKTADAIATHLHLSAVRVVNLHLEVGDLGRMNGQKLIGTDAEAAIAKLLGQLFELAVLSIETIDKNKIVAAAVHLGKMNVHLLFDPFNLLQDRRDHFAFDEILKAFSFADDVKAISVHQDLVRPRMSIIVRCHRKTISPDAHNREQVSRLGAWNLPILGEKIAAFTNGSDYIGHNRIRRSLNHGTNRLIRAVKSRANEIVHSAIDNDKLLLIVLLQIKHLSNQNSCVPHDHAARLKDQRHIEPLEAPDQASSIFIRLRRLFIFVPYAQPSAKVQVANVRPFLPQISDQYPIQILSHS